MASPKQNGPTGPLHTRSFYLMLTAFLLYVVVYLSILGGKGILPIGWGWVWFWIWGFSYPIRRIASLRSGTYQTPPLSSYSGVAKEKEYRHIVKTLVGFVTATAIALVLLGAQLTAGLISGRSAVIAVVLFNSYGWFAYSWWREALGMIIGYREEQRNRMAIALLPASPIIDNRAMSPVVRATPTELPIQAVRSGIGQP